MKDLNLIYFTAQELPPEERSAYLTQACAGDLELQARVEQMLAIAGQADAFFTNDKAEAASEARKSARGPAKTLKVAPDDAPDEIIGQKIGRYKILERVGEGGCGVVYVAEQTEPVRRRVALKVIKLGMDTKTVVARFEAERQALAMMDHPNIARVLDAGATESGRPYFIMELVRGIKITEYCDTANLSTRERLDLFIKVCQAIQHAHQKGIIHRDIKPSNILVTLNDGAPVPKVIDFGIAKATEGRLTEATVYTQLHQFIGTPAYMSPEQAEMSSLDIDTRSDIYSLGVLLYELLTGKTPFDVKELMSKGLDAMRRTIREVEPARPSTRLATLSGDDLTTAARRRSVPANQLQNQLRGDLDWIVMKALEKERTRRYDTANGLAMDIQRHLNTEPVAARPSSLGYQLEKAIRRNKLAFAASAAIAASLLVGIAVSLSQAFRARAEQRKAMAEATRATTAEKKTADTLAQVGAERDAKDVARQDAEAVSRLFVNILASPDPTRDGRTITVAETLDRAVTNLDRTLANQPDRRAQLQAVLGATYSHLGLYQQAVPLKEAVYAYDLKKLGPQSTNTLTSMLSLAVTYDHAGRWDEALKLREKGVELRRKVLGPEHPDTLSAMNDLVLSYYAAGRREQAMKLMEEVLALRLKVNGPEHPDTLKGMGNLGQIYAENGREDEALKLRDKARSLSLKVNGPEHPDTLMAMGNLALSYAGAGRKNEALTLQEQVLALERKVFGPEHPSTFQAMNNLALYYAAAGRKDEALKLKEEVLALRRKVLGPEHPATIKAMNNLANFYADTGRQDEAIKLNEEVLALRRRILGPEHPDTIGVMANLAASCYATGRQEEAVTLQEQVLALRRKILGPEHPDTMDAMIGLAATYRLSGRSAEAIDLGKSSVEIFSRVLGPEKPGTLNAMTELAHSYQAAGRTEEAIALEEKALKLKRQRLPATDPMTIESMESLAASYDLADRKAEAKILRDELARNKQSLPR